MLLHAEGRGLEAIDRVTGSALDPRGEVAELSLVRIRLMAIHTQRMGNWFLEVAAGGVALGAADRHMLALQRKIGLGMIEPSRHANRAPTSGAVAGVAGLH